MSNGIGFRKTLALEAFRQIRKSRVELHELKQLFWECTLRCNAACRHCGSDCKVSATQQDMPLKEFLKVVDEIRPHVDYHHLLIILTGGEALMRKDIEQCGLELYDREFPWGMVTNGVMLPHRLEGLLNAGMRSCTVSLDGFEPEHTWMRQIPEGFIRAELAIRLLAQTRNVHWDVVTCANQKNYNSLPRFKDYLLSIGVRSWRIFTVFPVGRAAQEPELQLTDEQFRGLMDFIAQCRKEGFHVNYGCEGFLGRYEREVRDQFYECHAGVNVASVLADGSISGCPSIRANYYQGNIYKDSFWEVWNNRFEAYRHRKWMKQDICADCKMYRYCEGNGMHLRDDQGKLLVCHYKSYKLRATSDK